MDLKDLKGLQERVELQVQMVLLVHKVLLDHKEIKADKADRVL